MKEEVDDNFSILTYFVRTTTLYLIYIFIYK